MDVQVQQDGVLDWGVGGRNMDMEKSAEGELTEFDDWK